MFSTILVNIAPFEPLENLFILDKAKILSSGRGLTHYQMTTLDPSKLKEFADDNFKFDENGRNLFKLVENTVGKGECVTSNFSFSHSVFKRLVSQGVKRCQCLGMG